MRTPTGRGSGRAGRLARVLCFVLIATAPSAMARSRGTLFIERRPGEPVRALLADYEEACDRLGVRLSSLEPSGQRLVDGDPFLRVDVAGEPGAPRCVPAVDGRRVFDVADVTEDDGSNLPAVAVDGTLVQRLASADDAAFEALMQVDVDGAHAVVAAIASRGGAGAAPVLERLATDGRLSPVIRREVVRRLSADWSLKALSRIVTGDEAWPVRLQAAYGLLPLVERALLPGGPDASAVESQLVTVVMGDPSEVVRRNVLSRLPGLVVARNVDALRPLLKAGAGADALRGAAVESFAAASLLSRRDLGGLLEDGSWRVRTAAAAGLVRLADKADVAPLWRHLAHDLRPVRLAVSPLVERLDDDSIGPVLWRLLLEESREPEPDEAHRRRLADGLVRRPFDGLAPMVAARITEDLLPRERLLLSELFAGIDPERARLVMREGWTSDDPERRAVVAATAPDDAEARARRRALLTDPDDDLRAAAVIGLCRWANGPDPSLDEVELAPTGLGPDAMRSRAACGRLPPDSKRWRTSLEAATAAGPTGWSTPAAALALLVLGFAVTRRDTSMRSRRRIPGS